MVAVKQYILDCLRLLWMVFFRPISFWREVKAADRRQRAQLINKAIAATIVTPLLLDLLIGLLLTLSGVYFDFTHSLKQVAFGLTLGCTGGALLVVFTNFEVYGVGNFFMGIASGVTTGVLFGAALGIASGIAVKGKVGVIFLVALGVGAGNFLCSFASSPIKDDMPGGISSFFFATATFGILLAILFGWGGYLQGDADLKLLPGWSSAALHIVGFLASFLASLFRLPLFPLEVLATIKVAWQTRKRPHLALSFLSQTIAYWDEVMLLPQPLLWHLVVAVGEADRKAAMGAIVHLVTNTHQHRAAERALLELSSRELLRYQNVVEISERAPSSYWLSSSIPSKRMRPVNEAFSQCQQIAASIAAAVASSSDYQKLTTLHRARKRLEEFRRSAVLGLRGRERQNFVGIAQGWLAAVDAEIDRLTHEEGEIKRIPNPYNVISNPLPERSVMFMGRHAAARVIEEHFLRTEASGALVLYGQPRIGKTSLLRNLEQRLTPDLLPVYVDMQRSAQVESTGGLLFNLAKSIAGQLVARGVHVPPPALDAFAREPFIVFDEFLDAVERALGAPAQCLILALDEFEEIEKKLNRGTLSEDLMAYLRGMMQNRRGIRLLFAGTHTLDEMISGLWTPYFRSAVPCRVGYLDEASARTLITNPIKEFPLEYDADAVDWLIAQTHCQPCLIQLTCSVLVDAQNARKSRHATKDDVEQAFDQVVKKTGEYVFRGIWDWIPAGECDVLMQVALGTEPAAVAALAHALGKPEAEMRGAVERLIEAEVLLRTELGDCSFQVPLLRRWVARRAARQGLELCEVQPTI